MKRLALAGGVVSCAVLLGGCAGTPDASPGPDIPEPSRSVTAEAVATPIDGEYRLEWTTAELYDALGGSGEPEAARVAAGNSGEVHVTFDSGRYVIAWVRAGDACPGTFAVEGDRVIMTATTDASEWDCGDGLGELAADAVWTLDEQTLTLSDWNLSPQPALDWHNKVFLGTKPLERVK